MNSVFFGKTGGPGYYYDNCLLAIKLSLHQTAEYFNCNMKPSQGNHSLVMSRNFSQDRTRGEGWQQKGHAVVKQPCQSDRIVQKIYASYHVKKRPGRQQAELRCHNVGDNIAHFSDTKARADLHLEPAKCKTNLSTIFHWRYFFHFNLLSRGDP